MTAATTEMLVIEDSRSDARLIAAELQGSGIKWRITFALTLAEGLDHLAGGRFDVVLLDLSLPDSSGLDTFVSVREQAPDVAVVVLTGFDDRMLAEEAVGMGAQDYLVKGMASRQALVSAIRYAIHRQRLLSGLERTRRHQIEAKNRFLSHVSHELRSPLAVVHQFTTLLLDGLAGDLTSTQRDYLKVVLRNADQLRVMIDDLLEASRLEGGSELAIEPRPVLIGLLMEECARAFAPTAADREIVLEAQAAAGLPPVHADPDRVREVLTNLIDNAVKFTPSGGRVGVAARLDHQAGQVLVSVADSGCGIGSENVERVFDQFFQEHRVDLGSRAGLGLGLHLCRELVTRQGGRIWVESEPGWGSTFSFTLPAAAGSVLPPGRLHDLIT